MSVKRSRPGSTTAVRTGKDVGPDYPETNWRNPVNAGVEHTYEEFQEHKTLDSPNENTVTGAGLPLHKKKYAEYWEGK